MNEITVDNRIDLSIVIISYNSSSELPDCLASLNGACEGLSWEAVVVDNASQDGSADMVAGLFPKMRLIRNTENTGFGSACNQGSRTIDSDLLMFLNPDTISRSGSHAMLAAFMKKNPDVAAAGPRLCRVDGTSARSAFKFPTLLKPTLNSAFTRLIAGERMALHYPCDHPSITEGGMVDWLSGAAIMIRRSAFDDVEGFDERFFMYFEDTYLCHCLKEKGWRVEYRPEAEILHQGARSSGGMRERMRIEIQRSRLLYHLKHYGFAGRCVLRSLVVAAAVVRILLWLLRFERERIRTEVQIMRLALTI